MNKARLHLICIVAMFSLLMPNLRAQQTFRIYRNDGTMNVFFYSNLDSITFSAGNDPEAPLIQNFHTPDSVYQVPVNEIDSVSFNPVPTIYKNNAVKIEGRLRDYVTGCDSLTLFVKSSIPEELLPACGDNIATLECDDILPYGFIGKVENIVRGDDVINIECSKVSLLDVFDSLSLEVCASSDENPSASRSRAGIWPPVQSDLVIPSIKNSLILSHEIEAADGLSGTYDMTAFGELSTQSCNIYLSLLITPVPFQSPEVNFDFTYTAQNSITVGGSFSSSVKISKEFALESVRNIRIPGVTAVTEIFSEAGLFMEFEGKMGMNGSYTKPFTTVIHMSYNNKTPSAIPPTFKMIGRDPVIENSLEGSAAITLGLYGKLGIGMFCKELSAITAGFKTGITFSASIDPSTGVMPIETPNTEMYDELNRDDFFRGDFSLVGEITAELFGDDKLKNSLEVGDLFFRNPVYRRGVVPRFEEVSLNDEGEPGVLTASAKLKRKLISDVPVGFALYDDNKKFVDKWWADFKYKDNEGSSMTHKFEGLSANKSYTLHPITRAFNDNMVANPSATGEIAVHIITVEASNIKDQYATLSAEVKVEPDQEYTAGFYYYETNGEKKQVSVKGKGPQNLLRNISGLKGNTEYTYCAFIELNGHTEYGEEKTFRTSSVSNEAKVYLIYQFSHPTLTSIQFNCNVDVCNPSDYRMGVIYQEFGGETYFTDEKYPNNYTWYIGSLKPGTKYTVRAYLRNLSTNNITYSEALDFRTLREDYITNPVFKATSLEKYSSFSSSYQYITSLHKLEKLGGDGIIIDQQNSSMRCGNLYTLFHIDEENIFGAGWDNNSFSNIDYNNHTADGEQELIVKYAYPDNPDEWYWTRLPVKVHYTTAPEILDYKVDAGSEHIFLEFSLKGTFWIESIALEAELWETVRFRDNEGHLQEFTQKKDEQTLVITSEDTLGKCFRDGLIHQFQSVPWPSAINDSEHDFDIVVKNISINRRK